MKTIFKINKKYFLFVVYLHFIGVSFSAMAQDKVVAITSEPNHKIRFDNGKIRMYEVVLPEDGATLMHTHRLDNFLINFQDTEITNDQIDKNPVEIKFLAGSVRFSSAENGSYSHRVITSKGKRLHLIAMELLSAKPEKSMAVNSNPREDAVFDVALENSRGRVYRFRLAPGESTGQFVRPAGSMLFAISPGRIKESTELASEKLWDFEPGHFKWSDSSERLSIKNESEKSIDLVEIDVF